MDLRDSDSDSEPDWPMWGTALQPSGESERAIIQIGRAPVNVWLHPEFVGYTSEQIPSYVKKHKAGEFATNGLPIGSPYQRLFTEFQSMQGRELYQLLKRSPLFIDEIAWRICTHWRANIARCKHHFIRCRVCQAEVCHKCLCSVPYVPQPELNPHHTRGRCICVPVAAENKRAGFPGCSFEMCVLKNQQYNQNRDPSRREGFDQPMDHSMNESMGYPRPHRGYVRDEMTEGMPNAPPIPWRETHWQGRPLLAFHY